MIIFPVSRHGLGCLLLIDDLQSRKILFVVSRTTLRLWHSLWLSPSFHGTLAENEKLTIFRTSTSYRSSSTYHPSVASVLAPNTEDRV